MKDEQTLCARNRDAHPRTFPETTADNFNCPERLHCSHVDPDLHSEFSTQKTLRFCDMPGPITPKQVKDRLDGSRAALTVVIPKWEQSGTGFGAMRNPSDCGSMTDEIKTTVGDQRSMHLGECKPHVLHHWMKCEQQQILTKAVEVLSLEVCTTSDQDVGPTVAAPRKRKGETTEEDCAEKAFRCAVGGSMGGMACDSAIATLQDEEANLRFLKLSKIWIGGFVEGEPIGKEMEPAVCSEAAVEVEERLEVLKERVMSLQ